MSKNLRKILTVLLVIVMLFGISATTIAAASEGIDAHTDPVVDSIDQGFVRVEYTENEIIVTLTPDTDAIAGISKEKIKELVRFALKAAKDVVIEEILDAIVGADVSISNPDPVKLAENVWTKAMDAYVSKNYGAADSDAYIDFFGDALTSDAAINDYADYVCAIIEASVVSTVFETGDFPDKSVFDGMAEKLFTDHKDALISEFFDDQMANFKAYTLANSAEVPATYDFIKGYVKPSFVAFVTANTSYSAPEVEYAYENDPTLLKDAFAIYYASSDYNEAAIKNSVLSDDGAVDEALTELFGMNLAGVEARIAEADEIIIDAYVETLAALSAGGTSVTDLVEMLDFISDVKINGESVYGHVDGKGQTFKLDAIEKLVRDIPNFAEIAEMEDDEMKLSYTFSVVNDFCTSDFTLTAKLGGGYDKVRKIAAIIDRNLDYSIGANGDIVVSVNVPDELAKAALKACNSSRVPDELKTKVFAAMSYSPDDAVAILNSVSLDDLLALLDYIDFDEVLDSKFLSKFEQLDGLTADQIKAKVKQYEAYYNKAISVINRIYKAVPASVKDKTLSDLYDGNGTFSVSGSGRVDLLELAYKAGEKYADLVDALLDKTEFNISLDATVKLQDVYKVSYYTGTELVREGFLPAGADLTFFAGVSEYEGETIIAWTDSTGAEYEKMPEADVVLYALTADADATISATVEEKVYDGAPVTLTVTVDPIYPSNTYTYEWYRGTTLIATTTNNTLDIKNVQDSGTYYAKVTVSSAIYEKTIVSDTVTVTINAAEIDLSGVGFIDNGPYTYNGNAQGVAVDATTIPDNVTLESETDNSKTDAGDYTAVATFSVTDPNYKFKNGNTVTYEWSIAAVEYDDSDIEFVIGTYVYAPNTTHKVEITDVEGLVITVLNDSDKATNAGKYVTTVTVSAENTNYKWVGSASVSSREWTVEKATIDTSALAFENTDGYVYNGTAYKPELVLGTNTDIDVTYKYTAKGSNVEVDPINAGTYVVTATVAPKDTANYKIDTETVFTKEYVVEKFTLNIGTLVFENTDGYVYNGTAYKPELVIGNNSDIKVTYKYTAKGSSVEVDPINAGTYVVTATVEPVDTVNCKIDTQTVFTKEYDIAKIQLSVSLRFSYSAPFVYDPNTLRTITYRKEVTGGSASLVGVSLSGVNQATAVGQYRFTVTTIPTDTVNYEIVGQSVFSCDWEIIDATYDLGTLVWQLPQQSYVYDGTAKAHPFITVPAAYADLVNVTYNTVPAGGELNPTNAGTYYITAQITSKDPSNIFGYQLSEPVFEWTVEKADYDLAALGITFENKVFFFDGQPHSIEIKGDLPGGATVFYTGNGQSIRGEYEVVANIISGDPNYNDAQLKANMYIVTSNAVSEFAYGYEVVVSVAGGLAAGHELDVYNVKEALDKIDFSKLCKEGETAELISAYDIGFTYDYSKADVDGEFTVRILIPDAYKNPRTRNLVVVYVAPDGSLTAMETARSGDYAVFETNHFSVYALVQIEDEVFEEEPAPIIPEGPVIPDTECTEHVDIDENGKCDNCGADVPVEPDEECTEHVDEDGDGKCDKCGADVESEECTEHVDEDGDGKCDKCGADMPKDDEMSWLWIVLGILLLIIIVIIIILIITRKSDEDDEPKADETEPEDGEPTEEEAPVEEETVEEAPVEEAPVEEAPVEEAPVEEAPVEEAPVEEAPVEEAPVEEAPAEETPVEEAPVEEAPAEEPAPVVAPVILPATDDEDEGLGKRLVNGVIVPVRYRTSFMSRLIQAEPEIQDYYTVIKNALLSYKGVKARTSWNFESFNKGRIQCAKLNVKGSAFQLYLGLDPNEYNVNKYHFVDVSDKPKLDKVPMLLKIKSDRALKYALELIEEVMRKNEIEQGEVPSVDYHMPYETTEALVDRDLVKVILPAGMVIDENTVIERVNVGELLKDVKDNLPEEEVTETPVEEAPAEEPAPVEEPKVHIVDHRVAEEEIVHVDAVEADDIITDTQAKELVESVERAPGMKPKSAKCFEINLDTICENFEDGDTVTLAALKSKNLISKKADRMKVLARGTMTKKLTVVADKFSIQAIKMIGLAGGLAQKYKD